MYFKAPYAVYETLDHVSEILNIVPELSDALLKAQEQHPGFQMQHFIIRLQHLSFHKHISQHQGLWCSMCSTRYNRYLKFQMQHLKVQMPSFAFMSNAQ